MPLIIEKFLYELRHRFLLRWVIANVIGWTVGLYFGVLNPICFAGAGIVAGLVLGASQWWVLRESVLDSSKPETEDDPAGIPNRLSQPGHQWVVSTFAGASLGLIPALVVGLIFVLFSNG